MRCCLLRNGMVRKRPAQIVAPRGEGAHSRCYARALGGCSEKISKEHWLTADVMRTLEQHGVTSFTGFAFDPDRPVKPTNIKAKVLCSNHNSALSPLDKVAGSFFAFLLEPTPSGVRLFSGHDIQRWLLKIICGMSAARAASKDRDNSAVIDPDSLWIRVLFGRDVDLPDPRTGLYLAMAEGDAANTAAKIVVAPLFRLDECVGLSLSVSWLRLHLALVPPSPSDPLFARATHQPRTIEHRKKTRSAVLAMSW